jgi:hypothetical protein
MLVCFRNRKKKRKEAHLSLFSRLSTKDVSAIQNWLVTASLVGDTGRTKTSFALSEFTFQAYHTNSGYPDEGD